MSLALQKIDEVVSANNLLSGYRRNDTPDVETSEPTRLYGFRQRAPIQLELQPYVVGIINPPTEVQASKHELLSSATTSLPVGMLTTTAATNMFGAAIGRQLTTVMSPLMKSAFTELSLSNVSSSATASVEGRAVRVPVSTITVTSTTTLDTTGQVGAPQTELVRFWSALSSRRHLLTEQQFIALAKQIRQLLSDDQELKDNEITPSLVSFRGLLKFLSRYNASHPSVSLTKSGMFAASWSPDRQSKLTLTFRDILGGHWVGVKLPPPSPAQSGHGSFSIEEFLVEEPFMSWVTNGGR